jgi:hypothetical protein
LARPLFPWQLHLCCICQLSCFAPSTKQGHKAYKQELVLPDNLPVGQLRRTVAEWLGRPPQYVRLLGGVRAAACPPRRRARCASASRLWPAAAPQTTVPSGPRPHLDTKSQQLCERWNC